jgi:hypothetical protein
MLGKGADSNVVAEQILELYREEECYPDVCTLMEEIAARYQLDLDELLGRYAFGALGELFRISNDRPSARRIIITRFASKSPAYLLYMLPDPEFLTAVETAALEIARATDFADQVERISEWLAYVDKVLRKNGLPYRLRPGTMKFEWVGDPALQEIVLQPALLALADRRLEGSRVEFEDALRKRRLGTPKDLEHAVVEAAKAVESVLQVLHDECGVTRPLARISRRCSTPW